MGQRPAVSPLGSRTQYGAASPATRFDRRPAESNLDRGPISARDLGLYRRPNFMPQMFEGMPPPVGCGDWWKFGFPFVKAFAEISHLSNEKGELMGLAEDLKGGWSGPKALRPSGVPRSRFARAGLLIFSKVAILSRSKQTT